MPHRNPQQWETQLGPLNSRVLQEETPRYVHKSGILSFIIQLRYRNRNNQVDDKLEMAQKAWRYPGQFPLLLYGVEFEGLEWAFGKLSLYRWFAGVHLKVCTSRLVGCLV